MIVDEEIFAFYKNKPTLTRLGTVTRFYQYGDKKHIIEILEHVGLTKHDYETYHHLFYGEPYFDGQSRIPTYSEYVDIVWLYQYLTARTFPAFIQNDRTEAGPYSADILIRWHDGWGGRESGGWNAYQAEIFENGGKEIFDAYRNGVPLEDLIA